MPAPDARTSPCAAALFEMTTAIRARRRPSFTASMRAWRLLPRPEISTPSPGSARSSANVSHSGAARADFADAARRRLAGPFERLEDGRLVGGRARDDQSDPHVEGAEHVFHRHAALPLKPREDRRHRPGRAVDGRVNAVGQYP